MTHEERLRAQLAFVVEVDALKSVLRRNDVADSSRRENTAEHSWSVALMAMVLAEHADEPVDVGTVVRMAVVHDLVEVDAGDTYIYDEAAMHGQEARERGAADRIFGLLPADQGRALRALWEEFETGTTAEARFARAVDRMAGFLLNHASGGRSWQEHGVTADRVGDRLATVRPGSPALHAEATRMLAVAVGEGLLGSGPEAPAP
jgi:putative hydrolase of HD superfamily